QLLGRGELSGEEGRLAEDQRRERAPGYGSLLLRDRQQLPRRARDGAVAARAAEAKLRQSQVAVEDVRDGCGRLTDPRDELGLEQPQPRAPAVRDQADQRAGLAQLARQSRLEGEHARFPPDAIRLAEVAVRDVVDPPREQGTDAFRDADRPLRR